MVADRREDWGGQGARQARRAARWTPPEAFGAPEDPYCAMARRGAEQCPDRACPRRLALDRVEGHVMDEILKLLPLIAVVIGLSYLIIRNKNSQIEVLNERLLEKMKKYKY